MTTMTLCASHAPGMARDHEEQQGLVFRAGMSRMVEEVAKFDPTLVVYFGSDHRKAFTDIVPAISLVFGAEGMGDLLSPTGRYDIPKETAQALAEYLLGERFDVAVARKVALDHGFGQTYGTLFDALDAKPVVPIFLDCATPPLMTPSRAVELGKAVGQFCAQLEDHRILFLASGGLSHSPPVLAKALEPVSAEEEARLSAMHREAAKDLIRPEWDAWFLDSLGQTSTAWAEKLTQADIDPAGVGANEVRTWLAAYAAGGKPMRTLAYEPVRDWVTGVGIAISDYEAA